MKRPTFEVRRTKRFGPTVPRSGSHLRISRFELRTANVRTGFTLIELMLVASLVGIVLLSGVTLLAQIGGARTRLATQMDIAAEGDAALRAVTGALRNALRPARSTDGEATEPLFEVIQDEIDGRPADRLRFETLDRRPVRPGQPESDVREVAFSLESVAADAAPGGAERPFALRRRLDPTRNAGEGVQAEPGVAGGGVVDRLAGRLVALEVSCFDGLQWVRDWPATRGRYPLLVRVRIAVVANEATGQIASVQRTVNFPWLAESAPAAGGADSADAEPSAQERRRDE